MAPGHVLALDIGGTKLAAGVVDAAGAIVVSERRPTPQGTGAEDLWAAIERLLHDVRRRAGDLPLAGVGVGCGGPMTWPDGRVSPLNIPAWRDFPLRERLSEACAGIPVRVHNDAVCLAVAEHWRGAGVGVGAMLGMVVSTGVGGGLVLDGRLVDGPSGNAGHIGHVVVDPGGPPCACGGRGCLEAVASGPNLAAWALRQGWQPHEGEPDARSLAADAGRGHPVALSAYERAGRAVGVAVASATHLCDLELVTVGGGVAQTGPLLFDPLRRSLREHARLPFSRGLRVEPASLGGEACLLGAAALVTAGDAYWAGD
jgi:glucokinase